MTTFKIVTNDGLVDVEESHIAVRNREDLIQQFVNSDTLTVFRGENQDTLIGLYEDQDSLESLKELFFKRLFLVGRKSNYFLRGKKFSKALFDSTTDVSVDSIIKLFKRVQEQISENPEAKDQVIEFLKDNHEFVQFFLNTSFDSEIFRNILVPLNNIERSLVREYYWQFLHVIYDKYHYMYSSLISTSLDFNEAVRFGRGQEGTSNYFIFEYFIPVPHLRYCVTNEIYFNNSCAEFIRTLNLPVIDKPVFQSQREVSVRRALLPHYILSVYDSVEDSFILNPALNESDVNVELVSREGFDINQENFDNVLDKTSYFRFGYFDGTDWFEG